MRSNEELQKDVQDSILWEPLLKAGEIGVTVRDGVITLSGAVDSYGKKIQAEEAAKNVLGVKAVVNDITIQVSSFYTRQDIEIADEILNSYKRDWKIPEDKVKITVEKGWVTLDGEFYWHYQKDAARDSIRNLPGVIGVTNNISIKTAIKDEIEKEAIESALQRSSAFQESDIKIGISGPRVTLQGSVSSRYEKDEAERIVWNTPGVDVVNNDLVIN